MLWDHRPGRNRFAGIVLQEYSPAAARSWSASDSTIFEGTAARPHGSAASLQARRLLLPGHRRGRHRLGPRRDPGTVALAARPLRAASRQSTSSAPAIGPTRRCSAPAMATSSRPQAGDTYAVYLCGRPLPNRGRCVLGRETAIQKMRWGDDGWLRTRDGGGLPELETPAPAFPPRRSPRPRAARRFRRRSAADRFPVAAHARIPMNFQPVARPGYLRLYGRETIGSIFRQSLVARRQQAHCYSATTAMDFEPAHFQQSAGLVCYYNRRSSTISMCRTTRSTARTCA